MARTGSARAVTVGEIDLGDLAAPIAIHDMRTPLMGIVGLSEQLLNANLDPVQHDRMVALAETARHALAMADDLADIVRSKAGVLTIASAPTDLHTLWLAGATLAGDRAKRKGLSFHVDPGPKPGLMVMADRRRLSQIVVNLLDNAIKYTDEGSVGLSLRYNEADGRVGLTIEVRDTGPGIAEDELAGLLEPYRRGDNVRSQPGLGLGLYVTKLMLDALGGELRFEPAAGGGTRAIVDLDLPVAPRAPRGDPRASDDRPDATEGSSGHVLVVDDNAASRQFMEAILRQLGYEVTLANGGKDALAILTASTFDAILIDYEMPGMNGVEAAMAIRGMPKHADSPLLSLSAHRGGLPSDAPSDLFDAAIEKPVSVPALSRALDAAISAAKAV